jgi:aryl-alcohol dehydrogenase-like predicted oxidoreductase
MKYVDIPGTDLRPSALALGTATYGSAIPEGTAFRMMDAYAEAGGNVFDTANVYASWLPDGEGASERTIGKWLAVQGRGGEFLVSTKGAHPDLGTGRKRVSRADIRRQAFPVVAIVGPRVPEQAADSFAAGGVRLTAEEVEFLRGGGGEGNSGPSQT